MSNEHTDKDFDNLVDLNRKLRTERNSIEQVLHKKELELLESIGTIGRMKNMCWLATALSFIAAFIFGVGVFHSLSPDSDWNAIIGVNVGVWFFSVVMYYCSWRFKFTKSGEDFIKYSKNGFSSAYKWLMRK